MFSSRILESECRLFPGKYTGCFWDGKDWVLWVGLKVDDVSQVILDGRFYAQEVGESCERAVEDFLDALIGQTFVSAEDLETSFAYSLESFTL